MKFIPAKPATYSEIYQDSSLKFALANVEGDNLIQLHDFIKCRDFFNEALISNQIGCECPTVYRFKYPSETPLQMDSVRLILKGDDFSLFMKNMELLWKYERDNDLYPTHLIEVPVEGGTLYYLRSSRDWLRSSVMLSLFTHLLRLLYQYELEGVDNLIDFMDMCASQGGNAARYQKEINKIEYDMMMRRAEEIFPNGCLPFQGMTKIEDPMRVHNCGGIVSWAQVCSAENPDQMRGMYADAVQNFAKLTTIELVA